MIFRQGDAADVALLLLRGRFVATVRHGQEERQVGDIRPGEVVGEQALFCKAGLRNATVRALEPSLCLRFTPDVLVKAARNPAMVAVETHLLGSMARRIRKTNLAIQKAWHDQYTEAPTPERTSLRDRLRALFGGGR